VEYDVGLRAFNNLEGVFFIGEVAIIRFIYDITIKYGKYSWTGPYVVPYMLCDVSNPSINSTRCPPTKPDMPVIRIFK
jgi:hypothetical protein